MNNAIANESMTEYTYDKQQNKTYIIPSILEQQCGIVACNLPLRTLFGHISNFIPIISNNFSNLTKYLDSL